MWFLLKFGYRYAGIIIIIFTALTLFLGYQAQFVKTKVSDDELIPSDSQDAKNYDKVRESFGSDEVAVVYVQSSNLFDNKRLNKLKQLNKELSQIRIFKPEHRDKKIEEDQKRAAEMLAKSGDAKAATPAKPAASKPSSPKVASSPKPPTPGSPPKPAAPKLSGKPAPPKAPTARPSPPRPAAPKPLSAPKAPTPSISKSKTPQIGSSLKKSVSDGDYKYKAVERVESLFTVSNIRDDGGMVDTSPLLGGKIPRTKKKLEEKRKHALGNLILRRNVISEDGNATTLTLYLNSPKKDDPENPNFGKDVYHEIEYVLNQYKDDFDEIFQLGSPATQVIIEKDIWDDQVILLPLSGLVLVILIGYMLQSIQGAIIPILNFVIASAWTVGAMALLNVPINMLNSIVPALILVIGATEDVHMLEEFKEALARGVKGLGAISDVGKRIGLTLALTGMTTVLGFAATGLTDIQIMRDFGITAAFGMFARFVVSVLFVPAYLRFFGRWFTPISHEAHENSMQQRATRWFCRLLMTKIVPNRIQAIGAFCIIAIPAILFAMNMRMSNDLISFLEPESELVTRLNTLSENLAGTKVINITLEGNPGDFKRKENLEIIANITNFVKGIKDEETGEPAFDTVVSLGDYMALVNKEMFGGDEAHYTVPKSDELIAQYLLFFHHSQIKPYVTGDYAKANIAVRCNINDSHKLNIYVDQINAKLKSGIFGPIATLGTITGKSVMVAKAVSELSIGQTASIGFMATTLFIIISVLFISFKAASMTVIANLFSVTVLFGSMGLLGIPLNVGTCMVAAITIGIGIDDTLHLMVRYNKELRELKDEYAAIERAVRAEFMPVSITSLGLSAGFLVLGTSSFVPVKQFGLLSAYVIFVAVVADLILTPVLLSTTRLITLWDLVGLNLQKALMEKSPVFKGMNKMQVKKLILASDVKEYPAGSAVINTGDEGDSMYVVLEGELQVLIHKGNERVPISNLQMGEVFGEIALISKTKRTADVIAKAHTKVLTYNWEALEKLKRFAPYLSSQLSLNLASILGTRLVEAQKIKTDAPKKQPKKKNKDVIID